MVATHLLTFPLILLAGWFPLDEWLCSDCASTTKLFGALAWGIVAIGMITGVVAWIS
jgi:hypothetical protein